MSPRRRSAAAVVAASCLALIGAAVWLHLRPPTPLQPPPLSATGEQTLRVIDRDLGFDVARLHQAPDNGEQVARVVQQWLRRGKLTADGADFDSALTLVDAAGAVIKGDPRLARARIDALTARHRFVAARRHAEQAVAEFPDDEVLAGMLGDAAANSGDLDACRRGFQKSLALNSRSTIPYVGLSYCAELAGDLDSAVRYLEQAEPAIWPRPLNRERFAYIHAVLGVLKSKQGRLDDAEHEFRHVLAKQPDSAMARMGLADLAQWRGQHGNAEALLRGLIASESPNAEYQLKLADLLARGSHASDEAAALRASARAFLDWSVASGFEGYLRPLAALRLADGDYRGAAALAAQDLQIRPTAESRAVYRGIVERARLDGQTVGDDGLLASTAALAP